MCVLLDYALIVCALIRYPVHGEMYGSFCADSSAATVRSVLQSGLSAAICPGTALNVDHV